MDKNLKQDKGAMDKDSAEQTVSPLCSSQEAGPSNATEITPPQESGSQMKSQITSEIFSTPTTGRNFQNEDTNSLAFINEQLNFLNQASGSLSTNIHKSNKQVRQDLAKKSRESTMRRRELYKSPVKRFGIMAGRGLKRSPAGKLRQRKAKYARKSPQKAISPPEKGSDSSEDDEREDTSEDDDEDDEGWMILEDSDAEIDKALESNAEKSNLTAINVKNILHQVITNEHVVAMVKNSIVSGDQVEEASFEPKMTRSKVRHIMEEEGDIPHPWPLSPLKQPRVNVPSILDVEFPEDEEDDEYDPDKEVHSQSDEDSESVTSSQLSDLGSPLPSTPRTPQSVGRLSELSITPSTRSVGGNEDSLQSPMGPPIAPYLQKASLGRRYKDAMDASDSGLTDEETIALRTRSKLSLAETSLTELESTFVAPDITADMYDTECDDKDWQAFLLSIQKSTGDMEDTNDGCEDEDPEYNFLEEVELQEDIKEDQRVDRAVRVSKKEMNELMDELLEAYEQSVDIPEEDRERFKAMAHTNMLAPSMKRVKKAVKTGSSVLVSGLRMTDSERRQVDVQMRKHVQLLTQLFVVSQSNQSEYSTVVTSCEFLLKELKKFADSSSVLVDGTSAFNPCNLDPALELISEPREWKQLVIEEGKPLETPEKSLTSLLVKNYRDLTKHQKDKILEIVDDPCGRSICDPRSLISNVSLPPLTRQQKSVIWSGPVFLYPDLLPMSGLQTASQLSASAKKRVTFTEAEDNLLALGYEQFNQYPLHRELIQKFLLPCKTPLQIKIRIKNLTASKTPNIIKVLKSIKRLPCLPRYDEELDPEQMLAPKDQVITKQHPVWCKELKIKEIIGVSEEGNSIKRASSVNLPVNSRQTTVQLKNKPRSAPSTPAEHLATKTLKPLRPTAVVPIAPMPDEELNTAANSPKPLAVKSLQQGTQRCPSPGFIPLDSPCMEGDGQPASPVVVKRFDRDAFPSPGRLASQQNTVASVASGHIKIVSQVGSPLTSDSSVLQPSNSSGSGVSKTDTSSKSTPIDIRPCAPATPVVFIQGTPTCAAPTLVVINNTGSLTVPVASSTSLTSSSLVTPSLNQLSSIAMETSCVTTKSSTASCPSDVTLSVVSGSSVCTTTYSTSMCVSSPTITVNSDLTKTLINSTSPSLQGEITPDKVPRSPASSICSSECSVLSDINASPASGKKTALEIISSYGPFIYSPIKESLELSPVKCGALSQESQEKTPTKAYTPRYRPVAPNPFTISPVKTVSPFLEKKRLASPRRKQLNKKAQAICPKGFIVKNYLSPSKKAATNIVQRALKRGTQKILPKPQSSRNDFSMLDLCSLGDEDDGSKHDTASECDTMESEYLSDENLENDAITGTEAGKSQTPSGVKVQQKQHRKRRESQQSIESDDTQSEAEDVNDLYDSQNDDEEDDEDHIAELMAASTTIGFPLKKVGPKDKDNRSKAKKKKDSTLAMLAEDLLQQDPHKDDRDTMFAQAYLNKAKEVLKNDIEVYGTFLKLLTEFSKTELSPVKLYGELVVLLKNYPELITDFAGFLLPEQAVECGCFLATQEFTKARIYLRKLEINFERNPSHFQKCMRVLWKWSQNPTKSTVELRDALEPLLKGHSHLIEELSMFYENERPPESYLTDYEEMELGDSDEDELEDLNGYEEVVLPEEEEIEGTKKCLCKCHHLADNNFRKRNKHCYSCCLKVIDGELYYRVNSKVQKKVKVIYHKPVKARTQKPPSPTPAVSEEWFEDDMAAEKENVDISMLPDRSKTRTMNIKMKISHKKKGKGRFLSLQEASESPQKADGSPVDVLPVKLETLTDHPEFYDICDTEDPASEMASIIPQTQSQSDAEYLNQIFQGECHVEDQQNSSVSVEESLTSRNLVTNPDLVEELASLSPQKPKHPTVEILQGAGFGSPSKDSNMTSDILSKAVKVAMIGQGDLSMSTLIALGEKPAITDTSFSMIKYLGREAKVTADNSEKSETHVSSSDDVVLEVNRMESDFIRGDPNVTSSASGFVYPSIPFNVVKRERGEEGTNSAIQDDIIPVHMATAGSYVEEVVSTSSGENQTDSDSQKGPLTDSSALSLFYKNQGVKSAVPTQIFRNTAGQCADKQSAPQNTVGLIDKSTANRSSVSETISTIPNQQDKVKEKNLSQTVWSPQPSPQPNFINIIQDPGTPEITSSVIGFGGEKSDNPENSLSVFSDQDRSQESVSRSSFTSRVSESTESHDSTEGSRGSEDSELEWSRETDRLVLEAVKINGPSGKTFERLSKQIKRPAAEISKRFHLLLELLAEEETPSEDDTEDDKSSSSQ